VSRLEEIARTLRSRKKLPFDGKWWTPGSLILYLAKEVRKLRKNQCEPCARCAARFDTWLDDYYGNDDGSL
jgi:hypothetical protein